MTGRPAPRLSEPRPPAGASPGRGGSWRRRGRRAADRYRWLACCVFLAALPFATAPGRIISDTKFELVVNPTRFLSSALTLWDQRQFGGLLNQAVGYLFPMGPFFAAGRLLSVEGWIVQRLWIGLLLIAAFAGVDRLAGRMGIGAPWPRAAAGLAYALSPAALSIIGSMSGEFLPMAMLPWILIPLTDARPWRRGTGAGYPGPSARARAVARSAAAVALCSGMNASSAVAVIVPAFLYIVTRPGAWPRARMLAWWIPAVILVTCSWSVPLVLLSKYGVSIVPYTESAQVTSTSTSLLNIFRGTENWVSFLVVNGLYWRPIAFQIATGVLPTLLTGLLAALGLAGLLHRGLPERRFLLCSVLGGLVVISLGYVSSLGSPLEGPLISLVNGPGAPFRNLWKFDPLLRLPLALGLAHILARAGRPAGQRAALAAAASAALAGLVLPAVTTGLASDGAFGQVPSYWVAAAGWLNAHAGRQAVLVEPGSPFGQYLWGSPMDDVLQALTDADYAERDLAEVGSPGNERLLNAIDQQLAAGAGSAGLTETLARMGVKYVLVRNDLSRSVLNGAWPARISDALAASPGITPVAQFGPLVSGLAPDDAATDFDAPYPAVQIFQVAGAQPAAVVQPAAGTLRVYGAPESLITLAGERLLGSRPVLLNGDGAGQPVAGSVVTDSLRRRVVNFGQLRSNYSPTLTATEPADTFLATDDYTEPGWSRYQAVARYAGIKNVTASSSASDIKAFSTQWASGALPFSAVDGDLRTMWESGSWNGPVGQWIQEDFDAPVNPHVIKVAFAVSTAIGPPVTQVTVSTAAGQVSDQVRVTGDLQPLRVPAGPSRWLRITVTGLAYQPPAPVFGPQAGIAEIKVPGVSARRVIEAPAVPGSTAPGGASPSAVVLAKAQPQPSDCMLTSLRWVCSPLLAAATEEQYGFDQAFTVPSAGRAALRGTAVLVDPSLADRYARFDQHEATATASSVFTAAPQDQARSAFDGDPATTWIASSADRKPVLTIRWGYPRRISRVTITRPPGASGPAQLLIIGSNGQARGAMLGTSGVVKFAPMKTTSLRFTFTPLQAPLEVSDVTIPGVPFISTPSGVPFRLPCGLGPQLKVNGVTVPTRVSGTFTGLLTGRPMEFTACSRAFLAAGANTVTEPAADGFSVQDVVLGAVPKAGRRASAPAAAAIVSWTASARQLRVAAATRSYLVVNENFNPGWRAVIHGRTLRPVRLDGWKQAWILPAGTTGVVRLTYQPESLYRDAVVGGLAVLAVILLIAAVRFRRRGAMAMDMHPWPQEEAPRRWSARPRWLRWLGLAAAVPLLAGTGLLLGGYPGAVLVPAAAFAFGALAGSRHAEAVPWLLAGLLVVASACGAVGEHLALSGDIGLVVSAPANAIPQVICLIVAGGLAAALGRAGHLPRPAQPPD